MTDTPKAPKGPDEAPEATKPKATPVVGEAFLGDDADKIIAKQVAEAKAAGKEYQGKPIDEK